MSIAEVEQLSSVTLEFSNDDRLFHYTSTEGLYGILQSGMLWATHFQFLNDAQEFMRARQSLESFLARSLAPKIAALKVNKKVVFPATMSVAEIAAIQATNTTKIIYDVVLRLVDPFVFSTYQCGRSDSRRFLHGDLQHWATYGRNAGYAIQLDPKKLLSIIASETSTYVHGGVFCSAVEYIDDAQPPKSLQGEYETIAAVAGEMIENAAIGGARTPYLEARVESTYLSFVRIIAFIKDNCFAHEHEGRIVFYRHKTIPVGRRNQDLHIATKGALGVPYIRLFEGTLLGANTPIERIIIGPHPENVRRRVALESYLASRNLNIGVSESDLPYSPR